MRVVVSYKAKNLFGDQQYSFPKTIHVCIIEYFWVQTLNYLVIKPNNPSCLFAQYKIRGKLGAVVNIVCYQWSYIRFYMLLISSRFKKTSSQEIQQLLLPLSI